MCLESSESCSSNGHDIGLGTSGEDCSEGSWNAAQTFLQPIQSESEINRSKNCKERKVLADCEINSCTCANVHETTPKNVDQVISKNKQKQNAHFNYAYVEENDDEMTRHSEYFDKNQHKQSRKADNQSKNGQAFDKRAAIAAHSQFWFQNRPSHHFHQMSRSQFHAHAQQPSAEKSRPGPSKRMFY